MDEATLKKIIVDGDAKQTVETAEALGSDLANRYKLSTNQVRNIFGTVRRIAMNWPTASQDESDEQAAAQAYRELQLLKPKMAYQAKREGGQGVGILVGVLTQAIDLVGDNRQHFQHFVDFFEATLAYHKAKGGRN
jgi:CRISPR-associated protein Csm2